MLFKLITTIIFSFITLHAITLDTMKQESRVALIIANADYDDETLSHAVNQADSFNQMLLAQGFKTIFIDDASKREIIKALRKFSNALRPNGIALFYYQGQMVQYHSKNYIIPLESYVENEKYIVRETISLSDISSKMLKVNSRLNLFIVDALVNNSYTDQKGYAPFTVKHSDVYMSFKPNQKQTHAIGFTPALVELFSKKGISKSRIAKGLKTIQKNAAQPQPFIKTTNTTFYFNLPQILVTPGQRAWNETKRIDSLDAYKRFLDRYPRSTYISQAKIKITLLQKEADSTKEADQNLSQESNVTMVDANITTKEDDL